MLKILEDLKKKVWRCPFEVRGEKENTILEIELGEIDDSLCLKIQEGFQKFHADTNLVGMKFMLPDSLLEHCKSLADVKKIVIPYQVELLRAEVEYRLHPFLPYQIRSVPEEDARTAFDKRKDLFCIADCLVTSAKEQGIQIGSSEELREFMALLFCHLIAVDKVDVTLELKHPQFGPLFSFSFGGVFFIPERVEMTNPSFNKNCFSIVKSPFLPEEFGRYSKRIEIVLSREAHFTAVDAEVRRKIRYQSNAVLKAGGVKIEDLSEDKQPLGLWIPVFE